MKDKILHITADVSHLQIKELGPNSTTKQKNVIINISDTYALMIFKNGLDGYIFVVNHFLKLLINTAIEYKKYSQITFVVDLCSE